MNIRKILKVGAFIVRRGRDGHTSLLLFTQPDSPEAPIQIPGGTVEAGEDIQAALWREITEETGLTNLSLLRKVGMSEIGSIVNSGEFLVRHCFLLEASRETPDAWIHHVHGDGIDAGMRFSYTWHRVEPEFSLTGDLGYFLKPEHLPELYDVSCIDSTNAARH